MNESIDIDLRIEIESLLGKLGIDYIYDAELGGWLFNERDHIVFMAVSKIGEGKLLSFYVKLGQLREDYTKEELFELLRNNMSLAFASFALNKTSLYIKYVTQIQELDSEEFLVALKIVGFSIEKCADIAKNLIKTP